MNRNSGIPSTALQLRSLVRGNGELEVSLAEVEVPEPANDEVLVRVEATPINPSDLALLFASADMTAARFSGTAARPVVTAPISETAMKGLAGRMDASLPVGNEGAGVVVKSGSAPEAHALLGRTVAMVGGAMYTQYRTMKASQCLALPAGASPSDGASCFVNPLTALAMVETMRAEGHTALVHTAAASNLGQMLNRICLRDGIPLVNIVRSGEQEDILKGQGATHVCNSSSTSFAGDLTEALAITGATIAFDAVGGGTLAGQILACMESAINRRASEYSRYGSNTYKQVYIYGMLDSAPTEFRRNFGFAWGMGGWLLTPYLQKIGPAAAQKLRQRVVAELNTTFASHYSEVVSLAGALGAEAIGVYAKRSTGAKYLINPAL